MKKQPHGSFYKEYWIVSLGLCLFFIMNGVAIWALLRPTGDAHASTSPNVAGCPVFPADNVWNRPITDLPVMRNSSTYIASIGVDGHLQAYFGGISNGVPEGFPFVTVPVNQPKVPVSFYYSNDSNPGPYPIPPNVPIENGSDSSGDRHIIVISQGTCKLYEMWDSHHQSNGSWNSGSGATWDLTSDALRPDGWGAADAAGLPIFAGLVRYDEVAAGVINHALRFTVASSQANYLWPGRAFASSSSDSSLPPMALRLRLKANVNISSYSPDIRVILTALKTYGMFVADNGHNWVLSGAADPRWNNNELDELNNIPGSDFEAVDESSLQVSADSGRARPFPGTTTPGTTASPVQSSTSSPGSSAVTLAPLPPSTPVDATTPDAQGSTTEGSKWITYRLLLSGLGILPAALLVFFIVRHKRMKKQKAFQKGQRP